jgi:peptidoglycan/LPS O-acetylase OafA/YrhL
MGGQHMGETIEERLFATGGRTTGWDYLRASLSLFVIVFHGPLTCYGPAYDTALWSGWWHPLVAVVLPMFFALSGFLVTGSLLRSKTLAEFLALRAVRIVPALFCEVVISALLLGPLVTSFPLGQYFSDHLFYRYWLNIVGEVQLQLPGVFLNNPDPNRVNVQLWTIPIELKCYLIAAVTYLIGASRVRWHTAALLALFMIALPISDYLRGNLASSGTVVPGIILIEAFLAGMTAYLYRTLLPLSFLMFVVSAILTFAFLSMPYTVYIASIPAAYLTIYIGLCRFPNTWFAKLSDYSYGIYVYGYIIQQTYVYLFPSFRHWWADDVVSVVVSLACAIVSWHLIERPALGRRKYAADMANGVVSAVTKRVRGLALLAGAGAD